MDFGEAIPIPLDTADGSKVGRDDLTPPCKIRLNNTGFFNDNMYFGLTNMMQMYDRYSLRMLINPIRPGGGGGSNNPAQP